MHVARLISEKLRSPQFARLLLVFAVTGTFLLVVGTRLWFVSTFATDVPIRDQWDFEGATILKPWLDGTLKLGNFLRSHNEHRLVLARALGLALLVLDGQWDSFLETVSLAVICGGAAVAIALALVRAFGGLTLTVCTAVVLWLCLPYAQENTGTALGASYYFVLFLSLAAISTMPFHKAFSVAWCSGVIALAFACAEIASGVFAALIVIGVVLLQLAKKQRSFRGSLPTIAACAVALGLTAIFRPTVAHHLEMGATSFVNWLYVFGRCAAWPFPDYPSLAVLAYSPSLLLFTWYCRSATNSIAPCLHRRCQLLLALAGWAFLQAAAIGLARGNTAIPQPAGRYMDILAVGSLANFLAAVVLAIDVAPSHFRRIALSLTAIWSVATVGGAIQLSYRELPGTGPFPILRPMEKSIRAYVLSGDKRSLSNPQNLLAYPDTDRLAALLDDPTIRKMLPASVRPPITIRPEIANAFVRDGVSPAVDREEHAATWGCFSEVQSGSAKLFRSTPLETAFPYLNIEVAGHLGKAASVSLETPGRATTQLSISKKWVDPGWRLGSIKVPGGQARLVARDDDRSGWIGFREPREIGWLSMAAYRLATRGKLLGCLGLTILSGSFVMRLLIVVASHRQN